MTIKGKAMKSPKKSLQVTFDPPPTFAAAKAGVASNAPELRRSPKPKSYQDLVPNSDALR